MWMCEKTFDVSQRLRRALGIIMRVIMLLFIKYSAEIRGGSSRGGSDDGE